MSGSASVELLSRQRYRRSLGRRSPYYAALSLGRLVGSRCVECRRVYVPFGPICVVDGSRCESSEVAETGTVVVATELARRPEYAASGQDPLVLALVQLDGVDSAVLAEIVHGQGVTAGQRVRAAFRSQTSHPTQQLSFVIDEPDSQERRR